MSARFKFGAFYRLSIKTLLNPFNEGAQLRPKSFVPISLTDFEKKLCDKYGAHENWHAVLILRAVNSLH